MKILQRYVLRELGAPFLMSCCTLNFIFLGGYLVRAANLIIGRGIPLTDTMYILLLALPDMISYTVPMSILTAVLIVVGNFSQNNEIRAIKASGINPFHVLLPAFLAGVVLSFLMFAFNDQITSNAGFELRKATKKLLIKNPMALIEPGRFVRISESVTFLAKRVVNGEMQDIAAYENTGENMPVRTIIAERGAIVPSADNTEIQIRLFDGSISDSDGAGVQAIQFKTYEFPSIGQQDIRNMRKKTRDYTLAELLVEAGKPDRQEERQQREIWSAFHQRIAFSLGSFIFVFLGIPIAMMVNRGEIVISFAIGFAATAVYYILFVGAKTIAYHGIVPALAAFWVPNLLLVGMGGYMARKAFRR